MTLLFKIDINFNVYLLNCTHLEFLIENRMSNKENMTFGVIFRVPAEITSDKISLKVAKEKKLNKNAELAGRVLCINCDRFAEKNSVFKIDYKTIIKNYEICNKSDPKDQEGKKNVVPPLIRRIYGYKILDHLYLKFKKFDNWLKHEIEICDECYMATTK